MTASNTTDLQRQAKGSSFNRAMLLLPREKRKALLTLYALCRALDDAVDDAPNAQAAQEALGRWQKDIERLFTGATPHSPLLRDFQPVYTHYGLHRADMEALLAALRQDAYGPVRLSTEEALTEYCYGAASAVGLMAMSIFGCREPEARPFAIALGQGLQRTNILRDVQTDARLGRLYLPQVWLPAASTPHTVLAQLPQVAGERLAETARRYLAEADTLGVALPTRAIAPALAMRDVYVLYWHKLRENGWNPPKNGKIALSTGEKAQLAQRASGYLLGRYKAIDWQDGQM